MLLLSVILLLFFAVACSARGGSQGGETGTLSEVEAQISAGPTWPALALLKTGANPIWFELGQEGPSLIESPATAALTPYTPWPHARFITGIQMWEGFFVMAVNRDGFLILGTASEPTELILYRVADSALWDHYTTESFFIWDDRPLVLLYRNDFFSELSAPPLTSQVFALSKLSPVPIPASIGAFDNLSLPWEAEVVRLGPSGFWYIRMREKGQAYNSTAYFRTDSLATGGVRIGVDEWRNSYPRGGDSIDIASGSRPFSLPVLPEGFVFNNVALFGNVVVASWEEQFDAAIGAAGFMVMALDAN